MAIREEILGVRELPVLSVTASRLLEVAADPEVDVDDLARIIGQDPGLSARILGLANAAYFGQKQSIYTVQEAIIRVLGLNMVRSLALSISLSGAFRPDRCQGFALKDYWFHALGCAAMSRELALHLPPKQRPDADGVYLCGLLHNLGLLLLAHLFPEKLAAVYRQLEGEQELDERSLQREQIGLDWIVAGEWLCRRWHLPKIVCDVIGHLADQGDDVSAEPEGILVRSAAHRIGQCRDDQEGWLVADEALSALPGLGSEGLAAVEKKLIKQCEGLRQLSSMLS
jgi:HD-like signal output (HDOD) protein